jgi:tRNA pseudouridine55 synthase
MNHNPERFSRPAPPRALDPFDGVLIVDKPGGPTSHDIVAAIRRQFQLRKVGHGGTLDPQATGLLVILIGKGTRLSGSFMGADKTYEGVFRLGVATDSQDGQGKVIREADFSGVTREQVETQMAKFTGDIYQTPPMVSAVKIAGVPLYKRARKGQVVERKAKLIHVYEFRLVDFALPRVRFVLRCTKGTYVRTLGDDIGEALGCGAYLEELRRTRSGDMNIEDAIAFDDAMKLSLEQLCRKMIPMSRFVGQPAAR